MATPGAKLEFKLVCRNYDVLSLYTMQNIFSNVWYFDFFPSPESNIEQAQDANKRPAFGTKDTAKVQEMSLRIFRHSKRIQTGSKHKIYSLQKQWENNLNSVLWTSFLETNIHFRSFVQKE